MAEPRFGERPPRYTFALNPHEDARFSTCPACDHSTYRRKFALLIHVDDFGPFVLGKECPYCTKCEFIIAHQDELEDTLTRMFSQMAPDVIGNDYLVMGTVDKKVWKEHLEEAGTLEDILPHTADIEEYVEVGYEPARWVYEGDEEDEE